MSNDMIGCEECNYFHTPANGCPTPEMIKAQEDYPVDYYTYFTD